MAITMTGIPGPSSDTASADMSAAHLPGSVPLGWPAPYAEGQINPWVRELMKDLPLAVAVLDHAGRIVGGNDALHATVGPDATVGRDPRGLVVPADRELLLETVRNVVRGTSGSSEIRVAFLGRPDDKEVVTVAPVPPGLGVSCMIALRDVREQRRLEAQVQAATRMQAVGQLAGGIAHDFNNLLTAVLAFAEQIMERNQPQSPDHEAATEIWRNGKRAAALVAQLLAFARRQPQRPQVLDLAELLAGLKPLLQQLVGRGVALDIVDSGARTSVRADAGQIEQVIVNLAVNARDAMEGQGTVEIVLSELPGNKVEALGHSIMPAVDHAVISVRDTGTGIAPSIAGKIFEPFFTTKKLGEGTGLGLSTVYGIVKQSGGFIFASPAPERGTIFCIYLPMVPRPTQDAAEAEPALPVAQREPMTGKRLLLVEDEDAVRDVLTRGLRRHGLLVRAVADAAAALEALEEGAAFDALLSDVMMPGIDGVELASRVRVAYPGVAVLLMSGFAEAPLHKAAEIAGIRFIAKPFSLSELFDSLGDSLAANSTAG